MTCIYDNWLSPNFSLLISVYRFKLVEFFHWSKLLNEVELHESSKLLIDEKLSEQLEEAKLSKLELESEPKVFPHTSTPPMPPIMGRPVAGLKVDVVSDQS